MARCGPDGIVTALAGRWEFADFLGGFFELQEQARDRFQTDGAYTVAPNKHSEWG